MMLLTPSALSPSPRLSISSLWPMVRDLMWIFSATNLKAAFLTPSSTSLVLRMTCGSVSLVAPMTLTTVRRTTGLGSEAMWKTKALMMGQAGSRGSCSRWSAVTACERMSATRSLSLSSMLSKIFW